MIVKKYYNKKGKLTICKNNEKKIPSIRFKILKNGKSYPCCDFQGTCHNFAYAEVFPSLRRKNKNKGWSYLCRKHYHSEQKRLKWKLPACLKVKW